MAAVSRKRPWGEGLLDDTWDWSADVAAKKGYMLQVSLYPTKRLHVWRVVVRVLHVVDNKPAGVYLQHAVDWPDATYTGLPACILQAVSHLAIRLDEDGLGGEARSRESGS